ncbi:hypothetical protein FV585_26185 [Escherichia coli]|nr:hypothetical protein [Escherichia coli]
MVVFFLSGVIENIFRYILPERKFYPSPVNSLTGNLIMKLPVEGANKRGNSSRLTQSFHFFMFEPIFSPVNALNQPI